MQAARQVVGIFRATRHGYGFLECPGQPDLYVHKLRTGGALEGDTVAARVIRKRGLAGARAEIVRIVKRAPLQWVGILEHAGRAWIVRPHGKVPLPAVRIDDPTAKGARAGDLVVVEPLERTLDLPIVRGVIIERLGDPSDARIRILGIIRRYALPDVFPAEVRHAVRLAAAAFDPDDRTGRTDLRSLLTITIDPAEARDFDDAISLENLGDGRVRLGVHIADVCAFVPEGAPIDTEARTRGTSVYFPGFVVPMLPEVLSNGLCSLQPGEDRYTKTAFITYDREASVVATEFANTVIRSAARLTYEQATAALEGRPGRLDPRVRTLLKQCETLALAIRRRRLKRGMLVLSLPEVDIRLDEHGNVADAGPADTSFSHTLIEMFMVEANEAVSRELTQAGLTHLRRIHAPPEPDAGGNLAYLAPLLRHPPPSTLNRDTIRALLDVARGRPEEPAVNYILLRSLSQACYSPTDEGHFALASDDYCHFTSPIRRYPDLTIHRLLDLVIRRIPRKVRAAILATDDEVAQLGRDMSSAERRAQQAERDADSALLLMLMKNKVGATFDAIITGIISLGAFVQIRPYMAEGLLRVADFGPDDWEFDRDAGLFIGRRTRRLVHIGQTLRVQVAAVDEARQELVLVPAARTPIGVVPTGAARPEKRIRSRRPERGRRTRRGRR